MTDDFGAQSRSERSDHGSAPGVGARSSVAPGLRTVVVALVASLGGIAAGVAIVRRSTSGPQPSSGPATLPPLVAADVSRIAQALAPAVVTVRVDGARHGDAASPPAATTGLIVASRGVVITDARAVAGLRTATVVLADGRSFASTVVAHDDELGLAALTFGARGLRAASLASVPRVRVGDDVVVLGGPSSTAGGPDGHPNERHRNGFVGRDGRRTGAGTDHRAPRARGTARRYERGRRGRRRRRGRRWDRHHGARGVHAACARDRRRRGARRDSTRSYAVTSPKAGRSARMLSTSLPSSRDATAWPPRRVH